MQYRKAGHVQLQALIGYSTYEKVLIFPEAEDQVIYILFKCGIYVSDIPTKKYTRPVIYHVWGKPV